jgi:peptidoglycan hydrolase-like protein with peptidoglycan-binding domain
MKTKTIVIILVIVIVLVAGVWIWAGKKPQDTTEPAPGSPAADKANAAANTVKMPLVQGAKGELVKSIQTALNSKYNAGLKVDGIWGAKTQAALIANNLPTSIYWKQWNEITGLSVTVGGKVVLGEKQYQVDPPPWYSTALNMIAGMPASTPNYFGNY